MNKKLSFLLAVGLVTLTACGSNDMSTNNQDEADNEATASAETDTTEDETEEDQDEEQEETDIEDTDSDNDWEMQVGDTNEDGVLRLLGRNDTSETIETGSMSLDLPQVTVSEVVDWPAELADFYDFEPTGIISIDMEVSNSSEDTVNFYMDQATITTNTGEQLDPDIMSSDHIGGEFIGAVNKKGTIVYMLENSDPNEVEWVRILISAPHDDDFESAGDKVDVQIDF
ncbi:hypothetical protein [Shouchella lehensis]|uniref:DUF4352 domain-containing protein n=1 Tax=Shouchella lehensis G1 TaxID=1246626 RepID=A0A060M103_9BACI|nr:hypothetical protein [Shouchella lehensis]AIC95710.1 hypothetical protein BleG1_3146 [Shouchella lehensis G1]